MKIKTLLSFFLFCFPFLSTSHALAEDKDIFPVFNRSVFAMNQKLDEKIFRPIAQRYVKYVPQPVQTGVHNVFTNLREVPSTGNDLLQLNWYQALNDGWRFFFNSTIGIGGIIDVSSHIGLEAHYNDFGLTLAKWGCAESPYLVLPIFGPSTIRDTISIPVDSYGFTPYPYLPFYARALSYALEGLDTRADILRFQGVIEQASFDPYVFQRNAYLQKRKAQIEEVKAPEDWQESAKTFQESRKPHNLKLFFYQNTPAELF